MTSSTVVKPVVHSNEAAEVLFRWFWCGATHQQQADVLNDASESDRANLLAAMPPERRALVEPLLRRERKA